MVCFIFNESNGAYGYRRVTYALERDYSIHLNRKTVAKIMKQEGLRAKGRRKRVYSSYKGTVGKIAPNILQRNFLAAEPLQKLVSDVTQFNVGEHKVYLSPLLDLFNGEVLSWRIGNSPNMEFALGMLEDASSRLIGSGAIIHTDQGFQYQNPRWQALLKKMGCRQSMSRKGNCLDNAAAESFFGRLKTEFSDGSGYKQPKRFIDDLDRWIHWYNEGRIRGSLCGMTPIEYRLSYEQST
jgi:putative transposase